MWHDFRYLPLDQLFPLLLHAFLIYLFFFCTECTCMKFHGISTISRFECGIFRAVVFRAFPAPTPLISIPCDARKCNIRYIYPRRVCPWRAQSVFRPPPPRYIFFIPFCAPAEDFCFITGRRNFLQNDKFNKLSPILLRSKNSMYVMIHSRREKNCACA